MYTFRDLRMLWAYLERFVVLRDGASTEHSQKGIHQIHVIVLTDAELGTQLMKWLHEM